MIDVCARRCIVVCEVTNKEGVNQMPTPIPEHTTAKINTGDPVRDYRVGDYINAIDDLSNWFLTNTGCDHESLAAAMKLYADYLGETV